MSDYLGWLAVGSKGRVHYYKEADPYAPMKRIAVCGRKHHVFSLIEATDQQKCALCQKFLIDAVEESISA